MVPRTHIYPLLGRYKSEEFLRFVRAHVPSLEGKCILKTDLREEAFGQDQILFRLAAGNARIYGVDHDQAVTAAAAQRQAARGAGHRYLTADVRALPFKEKSFDLILSMSTLDHFASSGDFLASLGELRRVLKKDGLLFCALNNKCNLNFRFFLWLERVLGFSRCPARVFSFPEARRLCAQSGLSAADSDCIVHLVSPANALLKCAGQVLPEKVVMRMAAWCVGLARWLGKRRRTRPFTGWFIVLECRPMA